MQYHKMILILKIKRLVYQFIIRHGCKAIERIYLLSLMSKLSCRSMARGQIIAVISPSSSCSGSAPVIKGTAFIVQGSQVSRLNVKHGVLLLQQQKICEIINVR